MKSTHNNPNRKIQSLMQWIKEKWPWKKQVQKLRAILRWLLRWTSWLS